MIINETVVRKSEKRKPIEESSIGFLIIATGKYKQFISPLLQSMDKYLKFEKKVYLFSDLPFSNSKDISYFKIDHLPWPGPTLYRYHFFDKVSEQFKTDYLFYIDVDMLIVNDISIKELIGEDSFEGARIATLHPGYHNCCYALSPFERNELSKAAILPGTVHHSKHINPKYYCGGFNGGRTGDYIQMIREIKRNINQDEINGIVATWHDESHLNRYLFDNRPTKVLSPAFCFVEGYSLEQFGKPKIKALEKNHKEIRE